MKYLQAQLRAVFLCALLTSCTNIVGVSADSTVVPGPATCKTLDFDSVEGEHMVVDLEKPLVVPSLRGVVRPQEGPWPEGHGAKLELVRMDNGEELWRKTILVGDDGIINSGEEPENGAYCFRATSFGWQSVEGRIVVTSSASSDARLDIVMMLGV